MCIMSERSRILPRIVFGSRLLSVYVFGSVVEGKERPMSDVDVAIVLYRKC